MKYILLSLLLVCNLFAKSQDSSLQTVSVTFQTRDAGFIVRLIAGIAETEGLFDKLKAQLSASDTATVGTTPLTVTGVEVRDLFALSSFLRDAPYRVVALPYNRINTAIRLPANAWLNSRLDALDNDAQATFNRAARQGFFRAKREQ